MKTGQWKAVSRKAPCPICGRDSNCKVATDGGAVWCGRIASDRQNRGGQYLHLLNGKPASEYLRPATRSPRKFLKPGKRTILPPVAKILEAANDNRQHLAYWAARYCVPEVAWLALGAVASKYRIQIPEYDPSDSGSVVGLCSRRATDDKSARWRIGKGHGRGLTLAKLEPKTDEDGKPREPAAVLIVEGASDCAAVVASGNQPIGIFTRDMPLEQLASVLRSVPRYRPIILVVENDHPPSCVDCSIDQWRIHLFNCACQRAGKLATELGRPVLVSSPPDSINDFADWWRIESEGFGHLLSFDDRQEIGRQMVGSLTEHSAEVLPDEGILLDHRTEAAETFTYSQMTRSELMRHESTRSEVDTSYQLEDSCSFYKAFHRVRDMKSQYLFAFLGCKSWKCPSCRERILKPAWKIHLAQVFAKEESKVYRSFVESGRDIENLKRVARRRGGEFAVVHHAGGEGAFYSNQEISRGEVIIFDLRRYRDDFDDLLKLMQIDVDCVCHRPTRPIGTSRGWATLKQDPKQWKPLKLDCSPNQARKAAAKINKTACSIPSVAASSMLDGCTISFDLSDQESEIRFTHSLNLK